MMSSTNLQQSFAGSGVDRGFLLALFSIYPNETNPIFLPLQLKNLLNSMKGVPLQ